MPKIKNMPEARKVLQEVKDSVDALQSFFNDFEGMMDQLSAMRGESAQSVIVPKPVKIVQTHEAIRNAASLPGFDESNKITAVDRVTAIMRELKRPLYPKDIVVEYQRRKYPSPPNGKVYMLISGTIAYLYNRKHAIDRTPNGYVLSSNLSDSQADKKHREVSA